VKANDAKLLNTKQQIQYENGNILTIRGLKMVRVGDTPATFKIEAVRPTKRKGAKEDKEDKEDKEEEKEKVSGNPQNLALDKKPSISQGEQAINQLFVRVLKVERLLEKVKEKNWLGASGADDARNSLKF
jgi:hypothetical protein